MFYIRKCVMYVCWKSKGCFERAEYKQNALKIHDDPSFACVPEEQEIGCPLGAAVNYATNFSLKTREFSISGTQNL